MCSLNRLLHRLGVTVLGRALLCIRATTTDVIVEASDVPHALLELWLAQAITRHRNQLIRPILLELADLATCHDD